MTITQPETRSELVDRGIRIEGTSATDPAQVDVSAPVRPQFTITDAAATCAVSRKTITRKLADLAEHGAAKDSDGVWRIPVEALLAVGLHPGRSMAEPVRSGTTTQAALQSPVPAAGGALLPEREMVTIPRDRWDDVRIRLARAEAEASERALALADARLALRALTAAPHGSERSATHSGVSSPDPAQPSSAVLADVPRAAVAAPSPVSSAPPAADVPPSVPASPLAVPATSAPQPSEDPAVLVATARAAAAQRGGYVPPPGAIGRKRRWWQSK